MQTITDNIYVLVILAMCGTFLLVSAFLFLQVYNRNRFLQQKQLMQQTEILHQKKLMLTIFESQEEERRRIGSDLHDSVGAALSSLRLSMDNQHTTQTGMIDKIIADVRNISHNISPVILNLYGFTEAVAELADMVNQGNQLVIAIDNQAENRLAQLPHPVALSVYRVLEELLNNTIRHAAATEILLSFQLRQTMLVITYTDNGKGLPQQLRQGMGLANIRNRLEVIGATSHISPAGQPGFSIRMELPD